MAVTPEEILSGHIAIFGDDDGGFYVELLTPEQPTRRVGPFRTLDEAKVLYEDLVRMAREHGVETIETPVGALVN